MRARRATLGIVFLIVFVDLVGFGIVIPILPTYAEDLGPSPLVLGLLMASFSIMQLLATPLLGRLSDRYGRRPVLLLSLLGSVAGYVLFAVADSLPLLFLSRIVDGFSGGNISTAKAVIADITAPEDRARGMGLIGAAFGLGFIFGPAVGGRLADLASWMPGAAAAAASLLAFVLVLVILPETRRAGGPMAPRLDFASLARSVSRPGLGFVLGAGFLAILALAGFETVFAQWLRATFDLSRGRISDLFAVLGVLAALVQGVLVGRLARRYGEARLLVGGGLLAALALALLPGVVGLWWLVADLALLALGIGVATPAASSLVSRLASAEEQGGALGLFEALRSLARVVGPLGGELLYGVGRGWPFHVGAVLMLGAAGAAAPLLGRPVDAKVGDTA